MPIATGTALALGAAGGGLLGGLSGMANRRPPSLDPTQRTTLDSLINQLYGGLQQTPKIDPIQQALMRNQIAGAGVGGANRITNQLTSRGLGRSGLLAQGLEENSNAVTQAQVGSDLQLQQEAVRQRNETIAQIMGLLGVSNIPGQSAAGGFLAGAAPILSYFLARGFGPNTVGGGSFPIPPGGSSPAPGSGLPGTP